MRDRLLHSSNVVAIRLPVVNEPWSLFGWHDSLWLADRNTDWGMSQLQCILGSGNRWPRTMPLLSPNGRQMPSGLCKGTVKASMMAINAITRGRVLYPSVRPTSDNIMTYNCFPHYCPFVREPWLLLLTRTSRRTNNPVDVIWLSMSLT